MHDIRLIRDDPEGFDAILARRGLVPVSAGILALDEERRALTTRLQEMQSRRNEASKAIGMAMGQGDKEKADSLKAEVAQLKGSMVSMEHDILAAKIDGKDPVDDLLNVIQKEIATAMALMGVTRTEQITPDLIEQ